MSAQENIFTIPPWESFVDVLAGEVWAGVCDPVELRNYVVLLPSRRACREFMTSLAVKSHHGLVFEPMAFPFGDINLEEIAPDLALSFAGKTIISASQRQALLMQLLAKHEKFIHSTGQAKQSAVLADKLASLIDQANWEGVPLANIKTIVPDDMAAHWEIVLDFLKIIYDFWPAILTEMNMVEASAHKRDIMLALAQHLNQHGSKFTIIAAGSTGSIPATAELIKAVGGLANGRVYLPGIDTSMLEDDWRQIDMHHHQYNLKLLCQIADFDRTLIKTIEQSQNQPGRKRGALISAVLNPAGFNGTSHDLENCDIIECQDPNEEAKVIALLMRESIINSDKNVALITPDRALVKRVCHTLKRWGLRPDDSGGNDLLESIEADFIDKLLDFTAQPTSLNKFYALFKNPLIYNEQITKYEQELDAQEIKSTPQEICAALAIDCGDLFGDFDVACLIKIADNLVPGIWISDAGAQLQKIIDDIVGNLELYPPMSKAELPEFLRYQISKATLRVPAGFHPQLFVYGAIEARTQKADIVIMSGLNEGIWPASAPSDPWLNRAMRADLLLPLPERRFGLSAHDFVQGFCANQVYLTRAEKSGGAPTVPCRWFLKLKTYLQGQKVPIASPRAEQLLSLARQLDCPARVQPCPRPRPNPPVTVRPKKLSVTQIEKLITDPYSVYASKILKLRQTKVDESSFERRIRGIVAHEVLEHLFDGRAFNHGTIMALAREKLDQHLPDSPRNKYWLARFETTANWLIGRHGAKSPSIEKSFTEINGYLNLQNDFTLTARADRIDQIKDNTVDIIDYKTGVIPTKSQVLSGHKPQVLLEALILSKGGFKEVRSSELRHCEFWKIGGGKAPGDIINIPEIDEDKIEEVLANVNDLIGKYIYSTIPFYSIPRPLFAPVYNDYEHLARVKEWSKELAS